MNKIPFLTKEVSIAFDVFLILIAVVIIGYLVIGTIRELLKAMDEAGIRKSDQEAESYLKAQVDKWG